MAGLQPFHIAGLQPTKAKNTKQTKQKRSSPFQPQRQQQVLAEVERQCSFLLLAVLVLRKNVLLSFFIFMNQKKQIQ